MPSLDSTFEELRARLRQPEALNPAKSDPFFYFVHEPEETLAVKQKVPVWRAALEQDGALHGGLGQERLLALTGATT